MTFIKTSKLDNNISVPVIISQQVGTDGVSTPYVLLRKKILWGDKQIDLFKGLISCAYWEVPIIIHPRFTDKIRSLATLTEKGLLYRKPNGNYHWNIEK